MFTVLPPDYVPIPVSEDDLAIASLAWGFTIGFGWLTTWTAIRQSVQTYRRRGRKVFRSAYIWMIWLEIAVCLAFGIICWLYLKGIIPPSFAFYFCILTTWALQVQFLLQIIINRCSLLIENKRQAYWLKVSVAILITAVNISVYNIWVPARLQISEKYIWINTWWDRCEKGIYLIVDACLNYTFIRLVQTNLVDAGLTKYRSLVKFNMFIVGFSLSMDVLIISMMSLKNTFVYMQFHPLAYMVKLNIEMSMADLIGKIARKKRVSTHIAAGTLGTLHMQCATEVQQRATNNTFNSVTLQGTIQEHDLEGGGKGMELQIISSRKDEERSGTQTTESQREILSPSRSPSISTQSE